MDTGERDEYGMEPVDNLFSSPGKETDTAKNTNGAANGQYEEEQSDEEQSMELDDGRHFTAPRLRGCQRHGAPTLTRICRVPTRPGHGGSHEESG